MSAVVSGCSGPEVFMVLVSLALVASVLATLGPATFPDEAEPVSPEPGSQTLHVGDVTVDVVLPPDGGGVGRLVPVTLRARGGSGVVEVKACLDSACEVAEVTTLRVTATGVDRTVRAILEWGRLNLTLRRGDVDVVCCAVASAPAATSVLVVGLSSDAERLFNHEQLGAVRVQRLASLDGLADALPGVVVVPELNGPLREVERGALWSAAADGAVVIVGAEPATLGVVDGALMAARRAAPNPNDGSEAGDPRARRVSVGAGQLVFAPGQDTVALTDIALAQLVSLGRSPGSRLLPILTRVAAVGAPTPPSAAGFAGGAFVTSVVIAFFFARLRRRSLAAALGATVVLASSSLVVAALARQALKRPQHAQVAFWSIPDDAGAVVVATAVAESAGTGGAVEVVLPTTPQVVRRDGAAERDEPLPVELTPLGLRASLAADQVVSAAGLTRTTPSSRVIADAEGVTVVGGTLRLRVAVHVDDSTLDVGVAATPGAPVRLSQTAQTWELPERLVNEQGLRAVEAAALVEAVNTCATKRCTFALLVDPASDALVVAAVPQ